MTLNHFIILIFDLKQKQIKLFSYTNNIIESKLDPITTDPSTPKITNKIIHKPPKA